MGYSVMTKSMRLLILTVAMHVAMQYHALSTVDTFLVQQQIREQVTGHTYQQIL